MHNQGGLLSEDHFAVGSRTATRPIPRGRVALPQLISIQMQGFRYPAELSVSPNTGDTQSEKRYMLEPHSFFSRSALSRPKSTAGIQRRGKLEHPRPLLEVPRTPRHAQVKQVLEKRWSVGSNLFLLGKGASSQRILRNYSWRWMIPRTTIQPLENLTTVQQLQCNPVIPDTLLNMGGNTMRSKTLNITYRTTSVSSNAWTFTRSLYRNWDLGNRIC
jgi:hypothetical protein